MDTLILTENEVNQILGYLGKQPYNEVYEIIGMIQKNWKEQHKEKGVNKGNSN